jgi:hypothetical protein
MHRVPRLTRPIYIYVVEGCLLFRTTPHAWYLKANYSALFASLQGRARMHQHRTRNPVHSSKRNIRFNATTLMAMTSAPRTTPHAWYLKANYSALFASLQGRGTGFTFEVLRS